MKCEECAKEGKRSRVYSRGSSQTLLGGGGQFWDEDGVAHFHDPNTISTHYNCSEGHQWLVKTKRWCPAAGCDYGQVVQ